MTQAQAIVRYCKAHGFITHKAAVDNLGIMSFHRRLTDLEKAGYVFTSRWIDVKTRYGSKKTRVLKYTIKKQPRATK